MQHLKSGTLLQEGKYKINSLLGQGGFGITYLGVQEELGKLVAIKEFFYKDWCERDTETCQVTLGNQTNREMVERFLKKFIKEANTLSKLEHPNIVCISDIFRENGTAYYVMDYIEGASLADLLAENGALTESKAKQYVKQIAEALEYVHHRSINHLDVKPANIMIRKSDDKAILIDFGLSKQYDVAGNQTSTTPVGISHGYAPMEQYNLGGVSKFSPQTDIYSLGATLYKLVSNVTPPQASDVLNDGLPELPISISLRTRNCVKAAMTPRRSERPKNISDFLTLLFDESELYFQSKDGNFSKSTEETKILVDDSEIHQSVENKDFNNKHDDYYQEEKDEGHTKAILIIIAFVILVVLLGLKMCFSETSVKQTVTPSVKKEQIQQKSESTSTIKSEEPTKSIKENTIDEKAEKLKQYLNSGNYTAIKQLADNGYIQAYLPLAKYYLQKPETHDLADKYARKAVKAGISGANSVINDLEALGYYDLN